MNEYNIIEKVQSANSQLFNLSENINFRIELDPDAVSHPNKTMNNTELLQSKNRVTFSSDIEEYEDNLSDSTGEIQYKDDKAINKELNEIIDRRSENASKNDNYELTGFLRMSIEELYDANNKNGNSDTSSSDGNECTTEVEVAEEIDDSMSMVSVKENDDNLNDSPEKKQCQMPTESDRSAGMAIKRPTICLSTAANALKFAKFDKRKLSDSGRGRNRCRTKSADHQQRSGRKSATTDEENLLKIHLNVKSCCEFKYLDNNRLPRYNGLFSQYGLSKDQLEHREQHRRKCIENRLKRQREIVKAKQQIAELNELAFRQWLIRKNHAAKPKFKNFYDCTKNNTNSNSNSNTNIE